MVRSAAHKGLRVLVMVAPLGEPGERVRLAKTISIVTSGDLNAVVYWGWRRLREDTLGAHLDGVVDTRALLTGGGFRNTRVRLYYVAWMLRVFFALLRHAPQRVYCLGLETALPAWFASRFRRRIEYVFDDADRFVMLWPLPRPIEKLVVFLERRVSSASVAHFVPSLDRYDYRTTKLYEIANMPTRSQVREAKSLIGPKRDQRLHVYVNGWLDSSRGLALIDGAAELLEEQEDASIVFNCAIARLTGAATSLLSRGNVTDLGVVTHVQSLAQYLSNDVVVTFYDPEIRINCYAIPNKWGDAMAMGTPIILNEGIMTARSLVDSGAAFAVPFDDPAALVALLRTLEADRSRLAAARAAITSAGGRYAPFDEAVGPILMRFLSGG